MPSVPNLTGFTIMLVIVTSCIVPIIQISEKRKRIMRRCAIILLAVGIYLAVVLPEIKTIPATKDEIVYITDTGGKYHAGTCHHLRISKIPVTLEDAIEEGYRSCSNCTTPAYRTDEIRITFADLYPSVNMENIGIVLSAILVFWGAVTVLNMVKVGKIRFNISGAQKQLKRGIPMKWIIRFIFLLIATVIVALLKAVFPTFGSNDGSSILTGTLFALLTVGIYYLFYFVLSNIFIDIWKERHETKAVPKPPMQDVPADKPVCENPPERQICEALWKTVALFRKLTSMPANIAADAYLWTALFYVVTKQIRKQETVDKIYSHFGLAARLEFQHYEVASGTPLVREMRERYTEFAKVLNASGIDPRTDEGIHQLRDLLRIWSSSHGCQLPDDPSAFRCAVVLAKGFLSILSKSADSNAHSCKYSISEDETPQSNLPT